MPNPCTVTGNLRQLSNGVIAQGQVIFELANIGAGNPITVSGTGIFPNLKYVAQSAADGSFTQALWGNDNISPANTIYNVTYRDSLGNEVGPIQYSITGSSANLNSAAAASTTSPPVLILASSSPVIALVELIGQTASIGSTLLYAVPAGGAGLYRVSAHVVSTGGTGGTISIGIGFNDGIAAISATYNQGSAISMNGNIDSSTSALNSQPLLIYSPASQNINYSATLSAVTGSPIYQLRIRLEYMGGLGSGTATLGGPGTLIVLPESVNFTAAIGVLYLVTTGAGNVNATLPTAAGIVGQNLIIKKVDSGSGSVVIGTTGGQTIDGLSTYQLGNQWQFAEVCSDGTNWQLIDIN